MVVIIDIGMGNLGSIKNMLKRIGIDSIISSEIARIRETTKLILPGVGSFDQGMMSLRKKRLVDILNEKVIKNVHILGICLGMQLMANTSEEGTLKGLNWVNAVCVKFDQKKADVKIKIPHMSWNTIMIKKLEIFAQILNQEEIINRFEKLDLRTQWRLYNIAKWEELFNVGID